jgi:hypothetical protein
LLMEVGFRCPVSEGDILVSRFWKPGGAFASGFASHQCDARLFRKGRLLQEIDG